MTEFDPTALKDEIARKTEWAPLTKGGANFRSHVLENVTHNRLIFRASRHTRLILLCFKLAVFFSLGMFFIFFLFVIGFILVALALKRSSAEFPYPFLFGPVIPLLVGLGSRWVHKYMLRLFAPCVFDKSLGLYWKGYNEPKIGVSNDRNDSQVSLRDIRALQIIEEYCTGDNDCRPYYSYELNLVLQDASRLNVVDHESIDALRHEATTVAEFLGVPLWDTTVEMK